MFKTLRLLFSLLFLLHISSFAQSWQHFDSLRTIYQKKQSFDTALVYAEKSLNLVKEKIGENDTLFANMLTAIMEVNYYKGNYSKAIEYCQKEREIRKTIQGEKNPKYITSLSNLGLLNKIIGNYTLAEQLLIEAKDKQKAVFGENHQDYIISLNNLAILYKAIGNYSVAESLFIESKNKRKAIFGEKHPDYALSLNNLAEFYRTIGNYTTSESLHLEAKNIRKQVYGEKHQLYAQSLNNLALLYHAIGNYSSAELYYQKVKLIFKETLGEKHPDYATSINNLAALYKAMGNYLSAEPLYIEALNICKDVFGEKHPDYALFLNNLAELYRISGNYSKSEFLFLKAKNIRNETLGSKHPDYAQSVNNLAMLYQIQGNYFLAESLFLEAKNIYKEVFGEKQTSYATALNNQAELYKLMGNYKQAEPLFLEAKKIRKEILGEKHSDYAVTLNNLALLYNSTGKFTDACSLYLQVLDIINNAIIQNFVFLSEKEKELYFKTKEGFFKDFYSFVLKRKTEKPEITKMVFNSVVRNKGLLLKSSTAMRSAILSSKDSTLITGYKKWINLKKEISKLYTTEISKRKKNPEELEQLANAIEKDLVNGSQVFSDFEKLQNLTWESVKNRLKIGEAAIEFMRFPSEKKADTIVYCALVITPQSQQPEMIQLFYEKDLETILGTNNKNNLLYIKSIYGTNQNTNEQLYKLIWQPMEKYLEGVKIVYYSPDGLLHKISFSAIGKDKEILLCDNYSLNRLSSTGKLVFPESFNTNKSTTIGIYGGIEYSNDSTTEKIWQYLPGTKNETDKINQIFKSKKIKTNYLTGKKAEEKEFKEKANTFSLLHIASHGFFYPDPDELQKIKEKENETLQFASRGGTNGFGVWQFVMNKNPLMRSGLVFAGANNVWNRKYNGDGDDGVLTAQEVSQLDLQKTQLVVLSACETGLGDIKGSEGVYGLQRAFKMAGAKFLIMSLWQVPDKETSEFMVKFYEKLLALKDIRKSFNETQSEMRKKYDPFYWSAFVLIE